MRTRTTSRIALASPRPVSIYAPINSRRMSTTIDDPVNHHQTRSASLPSPILSLGAPTANSLRRDILLRPHERVGPKIAQTHLGIDQGDAIGRHLLDPGGSAPNLGLLGEVEVGELDVACCVEEDVCWRASGSRSALGPSSSPSCPRSAPPSLPPLLLLQRKT